MKYKTYVAGKHKICEILSEKIIIKNTEDALDIIGNVQYGEMQSDYIVLHQHNFEQDFFDLRTQKLGEVLQKFTNYRIKLAIIGDFDTYTSQSLKDFIYESNRHGEYIFVPSLDAVLEIWKS